MSKPVHATKCNPSTCSTPGLCPHARDIAALAAAEGRPPARRSTIGPARTR